MTRYRIAVDIGGTFTDCIVLDDQGAPRMAKALTTPKDPSQGVLDAVAVAARNLGMDTAGLLSRTIDFVHGSTIGTNTLVQRSGARTGLLTTRGHEDSMIIGRVRQKVAGLPESARIHVAHLHKAEPPLVARSDIKGIHQRVDARGAVLVELDLAAVETAVDQLVADGIEALAVSFLWSFVNPEHERRIKAMVEQRHPQLFLTISSDLISVLGEYERTVSTCLNSYIGPATRLYLERLEARLSGYGYSNPLLIMQLNGGLSTVAAIKEKPILTLDSGPVGGILQSKYFGALNQQGNVICTDVGGTTFDVGLIFNGELQLDPEPVLDQYAYALPKVLVKSIGAGGGSIGWVDDGGMLRVGPRSAGSSPGPAAYGNGGTEMTVTDAHVALGYLSPDFLLGGKVRVDQAAAHAALTKLAQAVQMEPMATAAGIVEISNAQMADLVRKVTVERGLDPRNFALFVYGGAGPVFAAFLAEQVGAKFAYIPADSGVFSALGMLTTDIVLQEEQSLTLSLPLSDEDLARLNLACAALDARVLARFAQVGFEASAARLQRYADMRFGMQVHEMEVSLPLSGSK